MSSCSNLMSLHFDEPCKHVCLGPGNGISKNIIRGVKHVHYLAHDHVEHDGRADSCDSAEEHYEGGVAVKAGGEAEEAATDSALGRVQTDVGELKSTLELCSRCRSIPRLARTTPCSGSQDRPRRAKTSG